MSNPDIKEEIEEIGSHLHEIKQQRKSKQRQTEGEGNAAAQKKAHADDDVDISAEDLSALKAMLAEFDAQDVVDTISTHARDWMGTLNEDLRHSKPSTLLTVFGLGVIVGRLTK